MKSSLSRLIINNHSCVNTLTWIILIPVFTYTSTVKEAFFSIVFSLLLFYISVFIEFVLNKYQLSRIAYSVVFLTTGIINVLVLTVLSKLVPNIFTYSISSIFIFLFLFNTYANKSEELLKIRLKTSVKTIFFIDIVLIVFSVIREFLITGNIFGILEKQGTNIMESGSYLNSTSFVLLFLATSLYIFSIFSKNINEFYQSISFKNITKNFVFVFVLSIISSLMINILMNLTKDIFILSKFQYILPFAISAVFALLINLLTDCKKISLAYSSLIYVITIVLTSYTSINELLLNSLKLFLCAVLIFIFTECYCKKNTVKDSLILCLTYAVVVTAVFNYIV